MQNPINMIKSYMGKNFNPEQFLMNNLLKKNNNPMINNLVEMAKNGNKKSIEEFARNLFKEQGRDFDKEYQDFMKQINQK